MNHAVILSELEQEYLLRVVEASAHVRDQRQFFLWAQGQLQALLPHRVLLCMEYGPEDELRRLECVHGTVLEEHVLRRLTDPAHGLGVQVAQACREGWRLPGIAAANSSGAPPAIVRELELGGFGNLLVHGSGPLPGGASLFILLALPMRPGPRHAYFFELALPHLHFALMRMSQREPLRGRHGGAGIARALSSREAEILGWVREGKTNHEIGSILGISALTVKNHLQRVYRALGVSNRAHALSRCNALRLLDPAPEGPGAA
ncbi:MAG: XrtB/PEP-CTERM-associated transcriptional regulator EpsA [Telluria sp.]